ncbi:MAG TPA: flagellar assembly protein FliW [Spirochaetia bacterium]|nr:flagellar assembly protein FliW [Spirochaetia bacterium]
MLIQSRPYGTIEVEERQQITFPEGLFGFEYLTKFVLLDASQKPFYWLQSLEEPEIAFILIDPRTFMPFYTPDVFDADLEAVGINPGDEDALIIFSIVTVPEQQDRMSANLLGPIIINRKNHLGRQCISNNPRWKTRHYILDELKASRGTSC